MLNQNAEFYAESGGGGERENYLQISPSMLSRQLKFSLAGQMEPDASLRKLKVIHSKPAPEHRLVFSTSEFSI